MNKARSIGSGLVGACVLTLIHEAVRRRDPDTPRLDRLGVQTLAKTISRVGLTPPPPEKLRAIVMVGDIASNSLYFSMIGDGKEAGVWWRGAGLGLSAGLGAFLAPTPAGTNQGAATRSKILSALCHLAAGLAAAAAARALANTESR